MDFDWFFRRDRNGSQNPDFFSDVDEHDFADKEGDENVQSFNFSFTEPFEDIEDKSHDMFKHMDDMLNQMFSSSFVRFGGIKFEDNMPRENDPRSLMLKDPDCKSCKTHPVIKSFETPDPNNLVDSDIDDEVSKHGLMLDDRVSKYNMPQSFSYKKFSSTRTIRLPDGMIEEHRTVTDSKGNVTTTVRRSIGNQHHEIITHTGGQGIKETQENFTNFDENQLSDFEKRWQDLKSEKGRLQQPNSKSLIPRFTPSVGDPSYLSLFKKFFGL